MKKWTFRKFSNWYIGIELLVFLKGHDVYSWPSIRVPETPGQVSSVRSLPPGKSSVLLFFVLYVVCVCSSIIWNIIIVTCIFKRLFEGNVESAFWLSCSTIWRKVGINDIMIRMSWPCLNHKINKRLILFVKIQTLFRLQVNSNKSTERTIFNPHCCYLKIFQIAKLENEFHKQWWKLLILPFYHILDENPLLKLSLGRNASCRFHEDGHLLK